MLSQIRLLDDDDLPLVEQLIQDLGGQMTFIDTDGRRLYCVRDWVYVVSGSQSKQPAGVYRDFLKVLEKRGGIRLCENFTQCSNPNSNNKKMDFTDQEGLFLLTTYMDDKSETVRRVKRYMAKSAVFVDWAKRNPGKAKEMFAEMERELLPNAHDKQYHKLLNEGFTPQEAALYLEERQALKDEYKSIAAEWHRRGVQSPAEYAALRNMWSEVVEGAPVNDIKAQAGIPQNQSRFEFSSIYNLVLNKVAAAITKGQHFKNQSQGAAQLSRDMREVEPTIDVIKAALEAQYSDKPRSLPIPKPNQLSARIVCVDEE